MSWSFGHGFQERRTIFAKGSSIMKGLPDFLTICGNFDTQGDPHIRPEDIILLIIRILTEDFSISGSSRGDSWSLVTA